MTPSAPKSSEELPASRGTVDSALFRSQFFKTEPCRFFAQGRCRVTSGECVFAHGSEELRFLPDLTKTSICRKWKRGMCHKKSEQCAFAHGISEIRSTIADPNKDDPEDDDLNSDLVNQRPRCWARQQSEPWSQQAGRQQSEFLQHSWSRQESGDSLSTINSESLAPPPLPWGRQMSAPPTIATGALPVGPVRRPGQDAGGPGGMQRIPPANKFVGEFPSAPGSLNEHLNAMRIPPVNKSDGEFPSAARSLNEHIGPVERYLQGCSQMHQMSPVARTPGPQSNGGYGFSMTDKQSGADALQPTPEMQYLLDVLASGQEIASVLDAAAAAVDRYED